MDEAQLKAILESLLFAAGEPVSLARLGAVLDTVSRDELKRALKTLGNEYAQGGRGLALQEVAGGYQLRTRSEFAPHVRKLLSARPPRLSRSLLETLAIIAYRQPITRPEIEELRGVDSGGVLETLLERRFIRIAGRKEAPGRPMLYATTPEFLEVFGLKDLDSLPDLREFQEIERASQEAQSKGVETVTDGEPAQSTEQSRTDVNASSDTETPGEQTSEPSEQPQQSVDESEQAPREADQEESESAAESERVDMADDAAEATDDAAEYQEPVEAEHEEASAASEPERSEEETRHASHSEESAAGEEVDKKRDES